MLTPGHAQLFQKDPVLFLERTVGITTLESYQKEICQELVHHERVCVAACHDLGKSFIMSRLVLWFMSCFPGAKVITTAPTFNQVQRILWSEIRTAHRTSKLPLGGTLNLTEWKIDDDWFAIGFTSKQDAGSSEGQGTSSTFQGFHGEHMLVVFDEATGINPHIWTQAEGLLTSGSVKFVAIGNPTSKQSEFYKCFQSPAWKKIHLSCFDSPNLKANGILGMEELVNEIDLLRSLPEPDQQLRLKSYQIPQSKLLSTSWVLASALKWGLTHPLFLSKVLGQFPEEDEHVLIPLGLVEIAQRRTPGSLTLSKIRSIGVDPARFGSDKTVITELDGNEVKTVKTLIKKDTSEITGEIVNLILSLPRREREIIIIDGTGIGAGVVDQLKERKRDRIFPEHIFISEKHFGQSADSDQLHFSNFKAQIFVQLSEDLKKDLILPEEANVYLEELPAIAYTFDSKGRYVIESKEEYKKRTGLGSPDHADSLALANFGRYDTQNTGQFTDAMVPSYNRAAIAGSLRGEDSW